jgi:hypothetical protein
MALNYTYLKYKDTYTLKNNGPVDLTYHISTVTCEATTEIKTGVILPNQTIVLSFIVDGKYSIYLNSSTETAPTFIVKYYNNLLTSFISMVEALVCGCSKCKECEECNQCEDYLGTTMKALAFNTLNYPLYQNYINQITQDSICIYSQEILCSLLHEKVYGNVETKDTMLRQISFYYLSFYYQDKFLAIDTEEKSYITAKYKFDKIGSCMRKLGIIPTDPLYMTTTTSTTTLSPCLITGTASVVVDPCYIAGTASLSTTTTSSTSSTSTSTSSTTTVCTRPTGLINKTFLYSYNFESGPSQNFTATEEAACAAAQNVGNPSYSFNGSANQMSSFTVGATTYAGISTDCLKTPDGYYISNLGTKEVVHVVSGVIVSIEICVLPS